MSKENLPHTVFSFSIAVIVMGFVALPFEAYFYGVEKIGMSVLLIITGVFMAFSYKYASWRGN